MDFELNEDQRAFADTAQQFADERLAPMQQLHKEVVMRSELKRQHLTAIKYRAKRFAATKVPTHQQFALQMKRTWARYHQNEDLISVGAYTRGSDAEIDRSIELLPAMRAYLQQGMQEPMPMKRAIQEIFSNNQ